ncbi:hypothetical protein HHI36_010230 [Cryptolaemus montrouzieri]|uniref:Uncharacterized protein n=1 Tax=Cryptolaemus montrouzieri TaxID=559131 RepID=A0ABD2MI80_9CUCU
MRATCSLWVILPAISQWESSAMYPCEDSDGHITSDESDQMTKKQANLGGGNETWGTCGSVINDFPYTVEKEGFQYNPQNFCDLSKIIGSSLMMSYSYLN